MKEVEEVREWKTVKKCYVSCVMCYVEEKKCLSEEKEGFGIPASDVGIRK